MSKKNQMVEVDAIAEVNEVNSEKKALQEKKLKAIAEAKVRVKDFLDGLDSDDRLKADLLTLINFKGRRTSSTSSKVSKTDLLKSMLKDQLHISGLEIYKQFKIGQPEMSIQRRLMVQRCKPEERVWMAIDEINDEYHLLGVGPDAPEGWDGYVPADEKDL